MNTATVRQVTREAVLYTGGSAVKHAAKLFLIPVYARAFEVAEYGRLEQAFIDIAITDILVACALQTAVLRLYFEKTDEDDRRRLFGAALTVLGALCLVNVLGRELWNLSGIGRALSMTALIVPYAAASNVVALAQTLARLHHKPGVFVMLTVTATGVTVAAVLVGLAIWGPSLEVVLVAMLAAELLVAILAYWFVLREHTLFGGSLAGVSGYLRFAVPIVITQLIGWVLVSFDRVLVGTYFGLADLAILGIAVQTASLLKLGLEGALNSINVWVYRHMASLESYYSEAVTAGLSLIVVAATVFVLFREPIVRIFAGGAYTGAAEIMALLMPSRVLMLANVLLSWVLFFRKDTAFYTGISLVAAVVTVVTALTFVPVFRLSGAALSATCIYGSIFLLLAWRTRRLGIVALAPRAAALVVGFGATVTASVLYFNAPAGRVALVAYGAVAACVGFVAAQRTVAGWKVAVRT